MGRLRPFAGLLMVIGILATLFLPLILVSPAEAQCGSSSSSCKNCHEVNAEYPVNGSGDWHISHAFGDFCAFCHAGNVQAVEQDAAHEGMIYPLSDPQGSCQSCHPSDYGEQAQVYAVALGVNLDIGGAGGSSSGGSGSGSSSDELANLAVEPIPAPGERYASGALLDYNRRYEIEVLGQFDTSQTGNLILWILAVLMLAVSGLLIWHFEGLGIAWRKARTVPDDNWRRLAMSGAYQVSGPVVKRSAPNPVSRPQPASPPSRQAPPEINLPEGVKNLDDSTQDALQVLLRDPVHGSAIIRALARLDPALVNSLQSLDKKDRDLLLAIVEQLGESDS